MAPQGPQILVAYDDNNGLSLIHALCLLPCGCPTSCRSRTAVWSFCHLRDHQWSCAGTCGESEPSVNGQRAAGRHRGWGVQYCRWPAGGAHMLVSCTADLRPKSLNARVADPWPTGLSTLFYPPVPCFYLVAAPSSLPLVKG